jgi:hypothetical protein
MDRIYRERQWEESVRAYQSSTRLSWFVFLGLVDIEGEFLRNFTVLSQMPPALECPILYLDNLGRSWRGLM